MREPLQQSRGDAYERPNQPWMCGLSSEGTPCPIGPGRRGRCPSAAACHPVRDGDRWRCNRSTLRGGPCEEGPAPDGACCLVYQCKPIRSLRSRRGRFVVSCMAATLGAICIFLSADWRNEVLSPGPLSDQHAANQCASCHAAADQSLIQWMQISGVSGGGHATANRKSDQPPNNVKRPSQTQLCLECHAKQIPSQWATAAHNVDLAKLLPINSSASSATDRRVDPHQALACSVCHREHHGPTHDLTWMSDNACQACHRQQIDSFATDHPEFVHWPVSRRTRIAFDHAAHQAKHFPKEKQAFDCRACHEQGPEGDFQRTLGYDAACAKCHDRDIAASWEAGVALFALPMLDIQALSEAGHRVGQWPEQAADEFDGALPPIAKLLLVSDPLGARALAKLGADFDFFDIDSDDPEQMQAVADVVWAMKSLLEDVLQNGHAAVKRRVEKLLEREISTNELAQLMAHLSPESLSVISDRWLTLLPKEIAARREETSEVDDQSAEPVAVAEQDREAAQRRVEAGGWFRDDLTLSIRYRPTGHADSWATAWINVLAEASDGPHAAITEPLLKQIMKPTSPGLCGQCHSLDRPAEGQAKIHWLAKRARNTQFTWFSHRPHLVQSQLADCQVCHRLDAGAKVMANYTEDWPSEFEEGFEPITRQDCAECHTPRAAGDSCLQCHRYHVGGNPPPYKGGG